MAESKAATKKSAPKSAKGAAASDKTSKGFTADEKAAMKERAREAKAAGNKAEEEKVMFEKIAEMPEPDRTMAKKIHAIIMANAPTLLAKTWYGMPAWALDDQIICFFQNAQKFKARYATLGFSDKAKLDDGQLWPTSYALTELTPAAEAKIVALVKKAVS